VLRDVSPPIWRQFQVWEDYTLAQLHRILQMVMGWENYHLYEFRIGGRIYGDPDLDDEREIIDAKKTRIRNVLVGVGTEFEYEYDFGDDWHHELVLESVMRPDPDTFVLVVSQASGAVRRRTSEDRAGMQIILRLWPIPATKNMTTGWSGVGRSTRKLSPSRR
jgi:hypothetical protein